MAVFLIWARSVSHKNLVRLQIISSRASGATVSARAGNHRKVSKTMPEGVQKRPRNVKKHSRNVSEITWTKSCRQKLANIAKRPPGSTPEAPKNRLKTDPKIHLGPRGPIIWLKVPRSSHFTAQTSPFIDFGYHFASFLEGICDPKSC